MTTNFSTRTAEQLSRLSRNSSSRHASVPIAQNVSGQSPGTQTAPRRSRSWLNLGFLFKQIRREGDFENRNHTSQQETEHDVEQHGHQQSMRTRKHGLDVARLITDRRTEDRAKAILRAAGVDELLKTTDAIEICTRYTDQKLSHLKQIVKDETMFSDCEREIRLLFNREIADLRIAAVGLEYDANRFAPEDLS